MVEIVFPLFCVSVLLVVGFMVILGQVNPKLFEKWFGGD